MPTPPKIAIAIRRSSCLAVVVLHGTLWASALPACTPPTTAFSPTRTAESAGELGNWYGARGEQQCAIQAFQQGLQLDPKSAPLHYSLALSLLAQRQTAQAAAEVQTALQLDPGLEKAYLLQGVIAHNSGNIDAALSAWGNAVRLDPSSLTALDWIAKTRIESGQYTAAADLLRTAPKSEDLALDLLVANSKAMLYEEAIHTAQSSLQRHPDWTRLRIALATVLVQRNRFDDGLQLLQTALAQQPSSTELKLLILRVLVLKNDTTQATALADQLYAASPANFDVLYLRGLLLRQAGDYAAALPLLQQAVAQQPQHFDARFNLGVTLAKLHRDEESRQQLAQAATLPGASPEVHFQLAAVERALGQTDAATAETRQYRDALAHRVAHDELVSQSAQAAAQLRAGDWRGSAAMERQILAAHPDDAVHWYDLALALDQGNDAAGEQDALEHAVHLRPGFALASNLLGFVQARAGNLAAAERSFRAAIASAPQYAEAENNLGSLLSQQGKDAEAEAHFQAAVTANPRLVDAWVNLAAILAARNQFDQARTAVDTALNLQPGNTSAVQLRQMLPAPVQASLR